MALKEYKTDNINLSPLSDLDHKDAEALIGKTIAKIEGTEYDLTLHFTDGTLLQCKGHTFEDCGLQVDFVENPTHP